VLVTAELARDQAVYYAYLAQVDSTRIAGHVFHTLFEAKDLPGTLSEILACAVTSRVLIALELAWRTVSLSEWSTTPTTALELTSAACTVGSTNPAATKAIKLLNPRHDLVLIGHFPVSFHGLLELRDPLRVGIEGVPHYISCGNY
jgi:hypothetical protein